MSAYSIALFLHLVGVLALFAGIGLEQTGLRQLRNAPSLAQMCEWMTLLRRLRRLDAPAGLTILASGGYLAAHGAGHHAWVAAGVIGMVAMAVLGAAVGRPRLLAIAKALPAMDGPVPSTLRRLSEDPVLRASAATRAALGLGVVFVMVVKPEVIGVVIVFAVALAIGAATALARGVAARGALAGNE
ncbi:MAG TPA: hypothetical protein VF461_22555 [Gemmatimonadaceae bacterium]